VQSVVVEFPLKRIVTERERLIRSGKWAEYRQKHLNGNRASGNQPLKDYHDAAYVGTVGLGSPAQMLDVLIDTSSANLWVVDSTCRSAPCNGTGTYHKKKFNSDQSSTYNRDGQPWGLQYGTWYVSGFQAVDRLNLASLTYATQKFGLCTAADDDFQGQQYEGILGLGWPSIAQNRVVPPMQNILPQLDSPLFTVWLAKRGHISGGLPGGQVTYGQLDNTHCEAPRYVPVVQQNFWTYDIQGVSLGTFSMTVPTIAYSTTSTILIGGPSSAMVNIVRTTGALYDIFLDLITINCNATLPNFVVTIAGNQYPIPPSQYMLDVGLPQGRCALGFFEWDGVGFGPTWVFGDSFMRQYCHVHDIGGARLGFALAK